LMPEHSVRAPREREGRMSERQQGQKRQVSLGKDGTHGRTASIRRRGGKNERAEGSSVRGGSTTTRPQPLFVTALGLSDSERGRYDAADSRIYGRKHPSSTGGSAHRHVGGSLMCSKCAVRQYTSATCRVSRTPIEREGDLPAFNARVAHLG